MTSATPKSDLPSIILISGYWLGAWAWDQVTEHLTQAGFRTIAITLPGLDKHDPKRATRTLDDQVAAIGSVIDAEGGNVILVAHSGANGPVSLALGRIPQHINKVVWVDSGPMTPGTSFDADFPKSAKSLPLPPFEELNTHASLEGISNEQLHIFREKAVAQPGPVIREPVHLNNDARLAVPTVLICTSMTSAEIMELAAANHPMFTEVPKLDHVELIDLPTGPWPMWPCPEELAEFIGNAGTDVN